MRKKKWYLAGILAGCLLFTSCGLLPKEEEYQAAPVVKEYEPEGFTYAIVGKEDVQVTKKISCVYSSAMESQLSFGTEGEIIQEVYCALGDFVKQGDLLAELAMGTLPSEEEQLEEQQEQKELEKRQTEELLEIEKKRMKLAGEKKSLTEQQYKRQLETLDGELALISDKLVLLREKMAVRRIIAPEDGSVTYIKNGLKGSQSKDQETVIRIVSGEECYFVADKKEAEGIEENDIVNVVVGSTAYQTRARLSGEEDDQMYFVLDMVGEQPEVGSRGSATLVLEERKDVLCLPNAAIKKIGDRFAVYYEDEDGVKNMKYIEVGLVGNLKSEILSGLEFGESIIVN